jgi:integrase
MRARLLAETRLLDATPVSVLAYAGLRPEEARALRWTDVGERTIRVERVVAGDVVKPTKTGRIRTVRLAAALADDLERWRDQELPSANGLVFPTPRGRSGPTSITATGVCGSTNPSLRRSG